MTADQKFVRQEEPKLCGAFHEYIEGPCWEGDVQHMFYLMPKLFIKQSNLKACSGGAPYEESACQRRESGQHSVLWVVTLGIVVHQVDEEQEQA